VFGSQTSFRSLWLCHWQKPKEINQNEGLERKKCFKTKSVQREKMKLAFSIFWSERKRNIWKAVWWEWLFIQYMGCINLPLSFPTKYWHLPWGRFFYFRKISTLVVCLLGNVATAAKSQQLKRNYLGSLTFKSKLRNKYYICNSEGRLVHNFISKCVYSQFHVSSLFHPKVKSLWMSKASGLVKSQS